MVRSYRDDCNQAKLAREGIVEQKPIGGKSKRAKPIIVQYRTAPDCKLFPAWMHQKKWRKWGSYRTVEEAQKVVRDQLRKHRIWIFQVLGENGELINEDW